MTSDEVLIGSVLLRIMSVAIVIASLGTLTGMIVSAPEPDAEVITASYNDTTNVTTVGWNKSYNN